MKHPALIVTIELSFFLARQPRAHVIKWRPDEAFFPGQVLGIAALLAFRTSPKGVAGSSQGWLSNFETGPGVHSAARWRAA